MHHPSRTDRVLPLLFSVLLVVAAARAGLTSEGAAAHWDPAPGIGARIQEPADGLVVGPGAQVALQACGWDEDTRWDDFIGIGYVPDTVRWSWTSTGGTFVSATNLDEARWQAPLVNGTYWITLLADDAGNAGLPPEDTGTRDDPVSATHTISIRVEGGLTVTWDPEQAIR